MKNSIKKKGVAILLAAQMVVGCGVLAFADDNSNSGTVTGAGTSEGHVEQKATSVTLPTDASATTFAYTMDPEGLVKATSHEKYGSTVEFPAAANDKQVYFNKGAKGGTGEDKDNIVYDNESVALKVTNKSSHDISLTVKAEAVAGAKDIPLVEEADLQTATAASLYLGLIVGSEDAEAIASDAAATKTVTVNGTSANFKIAANADNTGYVYRQLTFAEYKALEGNGDKTEDDFNATWKNTTFKLKGAVTTGKAIASDTTAPSVKVTWSWVDPSANVAPSITTTTYQYTVGTAVNVPVSLGLGNLAATGIASITFNINGTVTTLPTTRYSFANGTLTFTDEYTTKLGNASRTHTITFNDDAATTVEVTLTPAG